VCVSWELELVPWSCLPILSDTQCTHAPLGSCPSPTEYLMVVDGKNSSSPSAHNLKPWMVASTSNGYLGDSQPSPSTISLFSTSASS
jgi:hypothetical protein